MNAMEKKTFVEDREDKKRKRELEAKRREALIHEINFLVNFKRKAIAERGLKDLYFFNREILERDYPKRRANIVPHVHKEWWRWFRGRKSRTIMILVPRNCLKTTFFTVGFTLQQIAKNRDVRILLANAKLDNAVKFLSEIKNIIRENESFKENYGEFYNQDLKWSETEIEVAGRSSRVREPTVTAIGAGAGLASLHFDYIIGDDLMNEVNSATKDQSQKVIDWWRRAESLLDPLTGTSITIGTRWTYYDLYHYIEKVYPGKKDVFIRTAYNKDGSAYYPEMLSVEELERIKAKEGSAIFSAFYLNDPTDEESAIIKKENIHYYDVPCPCGQKHHLPSREQMSVFVSCDPSFSQNASADRSAIEVVGLDMDGVWWLLESSCGRWSTQELFDRLFDTYSRYKPLGMSIETVGQAQGISGTIHDLENLRGVYLPLTEIKTRGGVNKSARVRSMLQPRFEQDRVIISSKMADLEEELLRFPHTAHDDAIDALSDIAEICFSPAKEVEAAPEPVTMEERIAAQLSKKNYYVDVFMGEDF